MSHFKVISSTKASDVIPVTKYVSNKTGITVIIANVEGPVVNGFFCLATEAHDDDGLPHTLEHLIFLGSERYPYKGILDLLANRCMAHGTNAWTDTDHTCYTIYTAGDAGMLTLLPIYLDHILRPTLTDHGFVTEVHHIDEEGQDAGVVYCEMQGRENSADSRCELKLLRAMYPDHGYSAETGGIMKNLRESTDNVKVKDFHKKFYRPENLTIILTGQIDAADVFKALETVEDDIIAKRKAEELEAWEKPWQSIPPAPKYGEYREQWPADIEDCGQVLFGWRGPVLKEPTAIMELTACAVLLKYLCDTAAAPLQRCLVEREDALAGDVSYNLTENMATLIKIELDNVPIDKLEEARDEAKKCLSMVVSGEEPIDMERMKRLVKKSLRETMASLESDPHHAVAFRCIGDALYSKNEQDFIARMNPQRDMLELLDKPADFWYSLLRKYFAKDMITVMGSPSVAMQAKIAEEEKSRTEEQRNTLGPKGLAEKAMILHEAIEFNERPPPAGTLAAVPVPSCDRLKHHSITTWASDSSLCPHLDLIELPMYARVHGIKTNFVYMNLMFDTTPLDNMARRWIPMFLNALGECPVRRGDTLVPHEQVISTIEELAVAFDNNIGFGKGGNFSVGTFGNILNVHVRCEPSDYEAVVNLLYEVLYCAELTKERLLVFAQRLINDVAQVRRNGNKMVHDTLRDSLYSSQHNKHWCSVLRQHKFLKNLAEQLGAGGDSTEKMLSEAKETFSALTKNMWLHLATDFDRYKISPEPWKKFTKDCGCLSTNSPPALYLDSAMMSSDVGGFVVGVGGVESCYVCQLSPGPHSWVLEDVAPLLVALNYFTQLEGSMWRLIRGAGLSYGYSIRQCQAEGRLEFSLYRATNAPAAYTKAKSIIEEYLKQGVPFDEDLFLSAKSTALFEAVEQEKCPADVVTQSLMNYLKKVGVDYNSQLVCAIASVTPESADAAARRWLPSLFAVDKLKVAVVCHPTKVNEVKSAFDKMKIKMEAFESMEESHFNK